MFLKQLLESQKLCRLTSIFGDENEIESFGVGYISSCNETDYIFQSISPRGLYDGFLLRKTNRIFKLDFNGSYEKKIQTLSKFNNGQHCKFDFGKENLVNAMLKFAMKNQFVVAIELLDSGCDDCTGFITSVDDEKCTIGKLDRYGRQNGITIIEISEITKINVDSEDEQDLKILYNANQ